MKLKEGEFRNVSGCAIAAVISKDKKIKNFESRFKKIEKDRNIILSEKQEEAIKLVNNNNVSTVVTSSV